MADDAQEKTEPATPKRMKEVRTKGKLQKSQDATAWLAVGGVAVMLPGTIERGTEAATHQLLAVDYVAQTSSVTAAVNSLTSGLTSIMPTIALLLAVPVVTIIAGAALTGGIHFKQFKPKYEQFNIVAGVKRTFGGQALWGGVKALLKTAVVGLTLYYVVQGLVPILMSSGGLTIQALIAAGVQGAGSLLQTAVMSGLVLAAADVFVVMRKNRKQTRMSLKEVKDENKNTDGDPLIKSQRRSRQLQMSRNRMITSVAESDVVLVNPTTYAVAVKYEPGKSAPRVVAKGAGVIAAKIREEAEKTGVPMVKDIPLTRALHAACQLGEEIPIAHYNAVAQILTFISVLKSRGSAAGVHTLPSGGN
jgi:flagellar biosynthetic protein FlhB